MTIELSAAQVAAGDALFRQPWRFLRSAPSIDVLPEVDRAEIAFAGRSNVGKSSLINALVGHHGLARTSNTPGRTQELNFFCCDDVPLYLVDMPGYGFAKAPKANVDAWRALIRDYLRGRPTLLRVLLLVDSRHGLKPPDVETMRLLDEAAVTYQVVLTKSDKLDSRQIASVLARTQAALTKHPAAYPDALTTSAAKATGIAELRGVVAAVLADAGPR